jgi:hypothetical protein
MPIVIVFVIRFCILFIFSPFFYFLTLFHPCDRLRLLAYANSELSVRDRGMGFYAFSRTLKFKGETNSHTSGYILVFKRTFAIYKFNFKIL